MYEDYVPAPVDLDDIKIPRRLRKQIEAIAKNAHEVWAADRINAGWTYGPVRNDEKKETPLLAPYEEISDADKQYDRDIAIDTVKMLIKLGYKIK